MNIVNRIKIVRRAEGLTQPEFCKLTGLKMSTLTSYELGTTKTIPSNQLEKITTNKRLFKYSLWLVTGKTAPKCGQIAAKAPKARKK